MRAAVLRNYHRPLELVELAEPAISRPDEVLVRVVAAGVCATDATRRTG
jgi:Zn-dependent alcohol dehydrogenase